MVIDPSKFVDIEDFKEEVDDFVVEIKDSGENIFIPGDMEVRNVKNAKQNGLPVDDVLYVQLKEIADDYHLIWMNY